MRKVSNKNILFLVSLTAFSILISILIVISGIRSTKNTSPDNTSVKVETESIQNQDVFETDKLTPSL